MFQNIYRLPDNFLEITFQRWRTFLLALLQFAFTFMICLCYMLQFLFFIVGGNCRNCQKQLDNLKALSGHELICAAFFPQSQKPIRLYRYIEPYKCMACKVVAATKCEIAQHILESHPSIGTGKIFLYYEKTWMEQLATFKQQFTHFNNLLILSFGKICYVCFTSNFKSILPPTNFSCRRARGKGQRGPLKHAQRVGLNNQFKTILSIFSKFVLTYSNLNLGRKG